MFIEQHLPCPDCGSSDARSIDDKGFSTCFACHKRKKEDNLDDEPAKVAPQMFAKTKAQINEWPHTGFADRCISTVTSRRFNVVHSGDNVLFPYCDDNGIISAAKRRFGDKQFSVEGDWKGTGLFGQHLFGPGGKFITIVEGEFDALAVYQMNGGYPVVSVKNGAGSAVKDCRDNFDYLDSYDTVVVCLDGDEPGKKAAKEVADLFGGKAKVFQHVDGYKDACDYLANQAEKQFNQAWWNAQPYTPDGIVAAADLWELVSEPMQEPDACYPWKALNEITYGLRSSELVTVSAGTGLGKSQFVREIFHHILNTTEHNVGALFLEENTKKTALSLMSLAADKKLHLPKIHWNNTGTYDGVEPSADVSDLRRAFDEQFGNGRVYLFDHFGSTNVENIVSRVRFMAKGLGCKVVFLDHVSIVVSAQNNGDERKAIDEIMTRLRMIAQETDIVLIVVSHLKRPDNKGHEEGAATSLSQLRGSGSIGQLSDMVIGLERNGQAEDAIERNTTKVRILKNRFSGETGKACDLFYDGNTGRMYEAIAAAEEAL